MPSKEDICVVPETKKEFLTTDMEELVAAIKHNLQLKARPLQRYTTKQRRMSPYSAPSLRTVVCKHHSSDKENSTDHSPYSCKLCILKSKSPIKSNTSDDPYEMLQELIREGSLIKEAVKRLQLGVESNISKKKTDFYHLDIDDVELLDVENI